MGLTIFYKQTVFANFLQNMVVVAVERMPVCKNGLAVVLWCALVGRAGWGGKPFNPPKQNLLTKALTSSIIKTHEKLKKERRASMKVLINHSNHPSIRWSKKQQEDWENIIDILFPEVPPCADTEEVLALVKENCGKIAQEIDIAQKLNNSEVYVYIAGEYTYSYLMFDLLRKMYPNIKIAIPTTARMVLEKTKEDGSVEKVSVFEFVRWRVITP